MTFETYQEAEQWVLSRKKILVYFEPFQEAMRMLGNPEKGLSCIHVAGTNGKGSTSRFISDLCRSSYQRIGLYTSPHLENIRDRIRINDEWIPEDVFLRYVNEHMDVIEACNLGMVGICSMMCFLWFQEQQVDLAVIEVSLGGRYDTTNVIDPPIAAVITSIGFDHMEFFGNTLHEIAMEKAGIIKPGTRLILGPMKPEADEAIRACAASMEVPVISLPDSFQLEEDGFLFEQDHYRLSADAVYLRRNAALALLAVKEAGIDIHSEVSHQALQASKWPGRFETVSQHPRIILDGAHNPDGIEALIEASAHCTRPRVVVFSALEDKQGPLMRSMLEGAFDEVITTQFSDLRADSAAHLGGVHIMNNWKEAIEAAKRAAGETGTVVITGSLYFIAQVRAYLR